MAALPLLPYLSYILFSRAFGGKWRAECLNIRFPLPSLLCAGYSVKLILFSKYIRRVRKHMDLDMLNDNSTNCNIVIYISTKKIFNILFMFNVKMFRSK